LNYARRSSA